jgi:hypothetical protein
LGLLRRVFGPPEGIDYDRDLWWLRTDGVQQDPPPDYDEEAEERAMEEAARLGVPLDPRAGYHRYDGDDDFEDGVPLNDDEDDEDP